MAKSAMQELISAITGNGHIIINQTLIDTYLEKERQQFEDCAMHFYRYSIDVMTGVKEPDGKKEFEQYYNEKFNKNK